MNEEERKRLARFPEEFSKITSNILDNDLLKIISTKLPDTKCPVPTLEARMGGYTTDMQEKIQDAWSSLITSTDPKVKQLGIDLFHYNIHRSGFSFSPKTFGHVASVDVRRMIPGYVEAISDPKYLDPMEEEINFNSFDIENFLSQFSRNHSSNKRLIPILERNS